jgi:hypothetical protein
MAFVDDAAVDGGIVRIRRAHQKTSDQVERSLRRRQSNPERRPVGQRGKTLERQRQVSAAARADDRVNLVDDHRANAFQSFAAALGS